MRTQVRGVMIAGVMLGLLSAGAPAALADDPVNTTADLVADAAPDRVRVIDPTSVNDTVTAEAGGVRVVLPALPTGSISLSPSAGVLGAPVLTVNLPNEIAASDAEVAVDGTVVYQAADGGADAAVQILDDGSTRVETITRDASGPHEFTYTFGEGVTPRLLDGGGAELVQMASDGTATLIGTVERPWAVDAEGHVVDTRYRIEGNSLVQTITTDGETVYPIVADPTYTYWWGGKKSYSSADANVATVISSLSALIPGVTVAAAVTGAGIGFCNRNGTGIWVYWTWAGQVWCTAQ